MNYKKIIKEKEEYIKLFIITFIIVLICYIQYTQQHFSPDGYMAYNTQAYDWKFVFGLGRPFYALVSQVFFMLGIIVVKYPAFFGMFMIIVFTISIVEMYKLIIGECEDMNISNIAKVIVYINCLIAFLNVFFIEWYHFSDAYIMFSCALLFAVFSIRNFVGKKYLSSLIFLFIALGFYQAVLGVFINWGIAIVFLRERENIKKAICSFGYCIIIAGSASFLNIAFNKIMVILNFAVENDRQVTMGFDTIKGNIKQILLSQKFILLDGYNLLPKYLLLGCFLILTVLILGYGYKKIVINIILIITTYASAFLPFLISGNIWLAQRTIVAFFSFFSILAITISILNSNRKKDFVEVLVLSSSLLLLILNVNSMNKITIDHFATNSMDYLGCKEIEEKILTYEKETGYIVDTILTRQDLYPSYGYSNITTQVYDMNKRVLWVQWALKDLFKYTMGRDFIIGEMDELSYQKWFYEKEWNTINLDEQIVFDGNIMYMMIY